MGLKFFMSNCDAGCPCCDDTKAFGTTAINQCGTVHHQKNSVLALGDV